ncbi:helix-turn-helix transcriptional regulator [Paenibacillus kribbensis]|uniref:helix-turn-helix domain-containing protein n=1 Tax=Paenibacillus kribbensis TaxID=172713 RepID=UPI002DBBE936|nr:helix-turn-helix transcriptional regulator [Paenibacillus kribbensis]MEC0233458.1 helix-turn-helix transcriptional regulator [Paenibacillus kribbensis]
MLKFRIKLKEVLKDRGITQKKLEELSGVPQSKISNVCNNKFQKLNITTLKKLPMHYISKTFLY